MRLKTFTAAKANEALAQFYQEMEDEVDVVSTQPSVNGKSMHAVAALDAVETASSFVHVGVQGFMITRIDLNRRLGAILSPGDAGHLAFSDISATPRVADGLSPINPVSLVRIVMPHIRDTSDTITDGSEANS